MTWRSQWHLLALLCSFVDADEEGPTVYILSQYDTNQCRGFGTVSAHFDVETSVTTCYPGRGKSAVWHCEPTMRKLELWRSDRCTESTLAGMYDFNLTDVPDDDETPDEKRRREESKGPKGEIGKLLTGRCATTNNGEFFKFARGVESSIHPCTSVKIKYVQHESYLCEDEGTILATFWEGWPQECWAGDDMSVVFNCSVHSRDAETEIITLDLMRENNCWGVLNNISGMELDVDGTTTTTPSMEPLPISRVFNGSEARRLMRGGCALSNPNDEEVALGKNGTYFRFEGVLTSAELQSGILQYGKVVPKRSWPVCAGGVARDPNATEDEEVDMASTSAFTVVYVVVACHMMVML